MRTHSLSLCLCLLMLISLCGCEEPIDDTIPVTFLKMNVVSDEIYTINSPSEIGTRLDPLVNDSIKADVTITYGDPSHGVITFIENEGWFYKAEEGYVGLDNFDYTLCNKDGCASASITVHVEAPYDPENCTFEVIGETVTTAKDTPIEIRIFLNDTVCPYMGCGVYSPEKGTFFEYSYSGSFKNIVYVYYPPKGYTGTDRFKYKLFTNGPDITAYCDIIIE
jgi:hypothetical protein